MVKLSHCLLGLLLCFPAWGKDLGVHGHTFPILEEDLLSHIEHKLAHLQKSGIIDEQRDRLTKKATAYLHNPQPVTFLKKTTHPRVAYFDPTILVPYDLKDHKGQIFYKAGTLFNPLTVRKLSKVLIFLASDDLEQVAWLKERLKILTQPTTLILVAGNPIALEADLKQVCYFDQEGRLTRKLKITQIPAIVQQDGLKLRIEEIKLTVVKEESHAQTN
jgi:conjugal transfer pilus assembly protein TraW